MKKNGFQKDRRWSVLIKNLMIMKLSIFILCLTVFSGAASETYSQKTKLSLSMHDANIDDVLKSIEEQSEFRFFYTEKPSVENKISVDCEKKEIGEVLDGIFNGTDITYRIVGRQIALFRNTGESSAFVAEQSRSIISGKITDSSGVPLPGVSVVLKGTTIGTITDADGKYTISKIPANATLQFSFVGMRSQEIAVVNQSTIDVTLEADVLGIDEVVAIGYGTQRKASLTGAISNMKTGEIANIPTSNLSNVLAGRLSGTFIRTSTGTPGVSSGIRIRQNGSWNLAEPLYVIDGVARDKISFDALDPNEVEDITILKDAASTAIYGSRAGNGVVLITTKKGTSGEVKVEYSSVFSAQKVAELPKMMGIEESYKIAQREFGNVSDEEIAWLVKNNPKGMNMYNLGYTDPNDQKHSISISGGSDKVKYFLGASYYDENGFLPKVSYKKYNLRANISAKVSKDLSVGLNLSNSYGTRNRFMFSYDRGDDLNYMWQMLLFLDPFVVPYVDGKPINTIDWLGNPVEMMRNGGYWRNNNQLIDAQLSADYNVPFVKGLSLKASYSRNMDNSFIKDFAKNVLLYDIKKTGPNNLLYTNEFTGTTAMSRDPVGEYIRNQYTKTDAYQFNGQINFDRHFGKHYVNATAVYEQYEYQYNYFQMGRRNFPLLATDQFFAASSNNSDWVTSGNEDQNARLSYVGRVNYEYNGKYFLSASVRRDGSTRFAPDQRWGWFPSVSGGWLLSEENFFKNSNLPGYIDKLKLRASYGTTGNDAIGGWQWLEHYSSSSDIYYMGNPGTTVPIIYYGGTPNPLLTWEESRSYNIGLDARFLRNIDLTLEFWKTNTTGILGTRNLGVPSEYGTSLPASNYGKADASGIEIELGYHNKIGKDFTYNLRGNFSYATTKIILQDHPSNAPDFDNPEGKTRTYLKGYQTAGILRTQADLSKLPSGYTIFGVTPELGLMNFADLSGPNGTPDGKIDSYDQTVVTKYNGAESAPFTYGLNINLMYKGLTLDALFAGLAGFKIAYDDVWHGKYGGGRMPLYHADSWSTDNPNGTTPKLFSSFDAARSQGYVVYSDFNVKRGDFLRLKNLQIGYNLPASLLKVTGISNINVFASGTNLFCWTKYKFFDPELTSFGSYPIMKTYSLGLNVKF